MSKFKITEITEWEINERAVQSQADHGDNFHEAMQDAHKALLAEQAFGGIDLPFVTDAESADEALAKYAEKYADKLILPTKAEIKELRRFEVSLQVDTRLNVEVYAEDAQEAGKLAESADFDMKDLEFVESHVVNAYDPENDKITDLF